jgi:hypothetical protein
MTTPAPGKPLRVKVGASVVSFESVFIQLGHVRVQGWISAANRAACFEADRLLASRLGFARSLNSNAYGTNETDPVSCPFCFDVQNEIHPKYGRREQMEETLERVMVALRSARYHFSRNTATAQ